MFGARREIIEDSLFVGQVAGFVPFLTELTAAANVRYDKNAATIEPKPAGEIEIRRHAHAVSAIAVKQGWIIAVERCPFPLHKIERDLGSDFPRCVFSGHFDIRE